MAPLACLALVRLFKTSIRDEGALVELPAGIRVVEGIVLVLAAKREGRGCQPKHRCQWAALARRPNTDLQISVPSPMWSSSTCLIHLARFGLCG